MPPTRSVVVDLGTTLALMSSSIVVQIQMINARYGQNVQIKNLAVSAEPHRRFPNLEILNQTGICYAHVDGRYSC